MGALVSKDNVYNFALPRETPMKTVKINYKIVTLIQHTMIFINPSLNSPNQQRGPPNYPLHHIGSFAS